MSDGIIYKQIVMVMAGIGVIGKTQQNKQQNYKFRGIDDVYNALHPQLKEHNVFSVPEVLHVEDEKVTTKSGGTMLHTKVTVKYTFYAEDGSNVCTTVIGEGMDSGDKSRNKAMTSAFKTAHFQIFCIPTDEQSDSENHSPEIADTPAKPALPAMPKVTPAQAEASAMGMAADIKKIDNIPHLNNWWAKHGDDVTDLPEALCKKVKATWHMVKGEIDGKLIAEKNAEAQSIADPTLAADYEPGKGE